MRADSPDVAPPVPLGSANRSSWSTRVSAPACTCFFQALRESLARPAAPQACLFSLHGARCARSDCLPAGSLAESLSEPRREQHLSFMCYARGALISSNSDKGPLGRGPPTWMAPAARPLCQYSPTPDRFRWDLESGSIVRAGHPPNFSFGAAPVKNSNFNRIQFIIPWR